MAEQLATPRIPSLTVADEVTSILRYFFFVNTSNFAFFNVFLSRRRRCCRVVVGVCARLVVKGHFKVGFATAAQNACDVCRLGHSGHRTAIQQRTFERASEDGRETAAAGAREVPRRQTDQTDDDCEQQQ